MITAATSTLLLAATNGAVKEQSSSFIVSPSLGLMIWTLLTFVIVLYVLKKKAFPLIETALERRRLAIKAALDSAEQSRSESEQLLAEYRERLAEARSQAEEIVTRARRSADQADAEAVASAKATREELLAQTKHEIEAETRRALQDIRREVANLTVLATEKVTRKTLTADDQQRLVEEALSEVDFSALAGNAAGGKG